MIVKDFIIEQTGGYVYVAWGSFTNGTYFSISSDILLVYDKDERDVIDNEDYDLYEWEQEHLINSYSFETAEFKDVLNQVYNKSTETDKMMYDLFSSIEGE